MIRFYIFSFHRTAFDSMKVIWNCRLPLPDQKTKHVVYALKLLWKNLTENSVSAYYQTVIIYFVWLVFENGVKRNNSITKLSGKMCNTFIYTGSEKKTCRSYNYSIYIALLLCIVLNRACPECRVTSDFVCPSVFWVDTKEEKEKLLVSYRNALVEKPCKYFKQVRTINFGYDYIYSIDVFFLSCIFEGRR